MKEANAWAQEVSALQAKLDTITLPAGSQAATRARDGE